MKELVVISKLTITVAVFTVALVFASGLITPKSEAAVNVVVNGGSGTNAERQIVTLNSGIRSLLQQLVDKEFNQDPNAERAANQAASNYTRNLQQALQNGYKGSPIFIENLEVYIAQLRATTTNNVLTELEDSNICGAFKDDLLVSLKRDYIDENARTVAQKQSCVLDEVTESNTEAFLAGDFSQGGLDTIWEMVKDPSQSPRGRRYYAESLVEEQVDEYLDNTLTRLDWNKGIKDVYAGQQDAIVCTQSEENGIRNNCRIVKPGSIWFEEIVKGLNLPLDRAAKADEIGDDQTAGLFTQLAQASTIPTNLGGFGTTTNPGPGTNPGNNTGNTPGGAPIVNLNPGSNPADPIPQVPNDPDQPATQAFLAEVSISLNDSQSPISNPIRPPLIRTLTKLQYQLETVSDVDRAENRHLETQENAEYQRLACYNLTFVNSLSNDRTLTLTEIPPTIDAIKRLYVLFIQFEEAVSNGQSTTNILNEFNTLMQNNFAIPNDVVLSDIADRYNNHLQDVIGNFDSQRLDQVAECERLLRLEDCRARNLSCDINGYPINNNNNNSGGGRGI